MENHTPRRLLAGLSVAAIAFAAALSEVRAGPYILAGTDADDHGSVTGTVASGVNQDGWFFMQRAIENIAPGVTNGSKVVAILGSNVGTEAHNAALSAFNNSSLPGLGWSVQTYNDAALQTFLQGGLASTGIVMMDSGSNVSGGSTVTERQYFTDNAAAINTFLGNGGGLFSQANGYGWVSELLPNLTVVSTGSTGISLTAAGSAAFPGLTNQDLSTGPWHNSFSNTGSIPILGTSSAVGVTFGRAVIIGSSGGSITNPDPVGTVPDAGSFGLIYLALGGLLVWFRRFAAARSA